MRVFFILLFILLAGGTLGSTCRPTQPVVVIPDDTPQCPDACEHLRTLGCEEGQPLEDGTTCEKFCLDTQTRGHALNVTCVLTIKSCDEMKKCQKPVTILDD